MTRTKNHHKTMTLSTWTPQSRTASSTSTSTATRTRTRRTTSRCFSRVGTGVMTTTRGRDDDFDFDYDDFAHYYWMMMQNHPVSFVGHRRRGERGGGGRRERWPRMMRGGMVVSAGRDTRGFKTEATASTPDGSRANENDDDDFTGEIQKLAKAMDNAKRNERSGYSPGAGLSSEEAAEAAFADLINTSNDTQLSDDDMSKLSQSSRMDDDAVARGGTKDVAGGVVGDLIRLGEVLLKGGHIVKKKDGRV